MRAAVEVIAVLAAATAAFSCSAPPSLNEPAASTIADRTFIYRYESGVVISGRFVGEREIHWEGLQGPAAGSEGSAAIKATQVAPGVWFVSWLEEGSDDAVSQTLNLHTMRVASFVTWSSPEGRQSNFDQGTLEEAADPS